MTLMAGQSWLPPTKGGIQSGAFQVPQLANTQKQYMPSQGPNIALIARDDYAAYIDDSVKMNHLKTMVTSKAKGAIAGLGYTAVMYNVAWNVLVKQIYSYPAINLFDGVALIKFARIVSSCVSVLTQFNYMGDINSEGVLDTPQGN